MWEYKYLEVGGRKPDKMERQLNELGQQGWELVSIAAPPKGQMGAFSTSSLVAVLKRRVAAPAAAAVS